MLRRSEDPSNVAVTDNPFRGLDFFETESGDLEVRGQADHQLRWTRFPSANGGKRTQLTRAGCTGISTRSVAELHDALPGVSSMFAHRREEALR
jgi:hypothetical protein